MWGEIINNKLKFVNTPFFVGVFFEINKINMKYS